MTTHPTMTPTFQSAMLSFSPVVNSRAELVTLAPGYFIYLLTLPLHILQFLAGTPQQHNANYCGPNNRYLTNNDN